MSRNAITSMIVLLIGGLYAVRNVGADGMLDPSFGNGGIVKTNFFPGGSSWDGAGSLVVLPDGRAVAAGAAGDIKYALMAAARYLPSGALDTSFGGDGLVVVDCEDSWLGGSAGAALLQPDGRLVLVGRCSKGPVPLTEGFWIVRLNMDGSLDPSFGTGGQVFTPFPGGLFGATGLLQPDGRIVAAGSGGTGGPHALKAARYNPDGSLDQTFGSAGQVVFPLAQDFLVASAALQPDGKLVFGGTYGDAGEPTVGDFGLVRLLSDGTPDPSFDGDGAVISDFGAVEKGHSVIVLGDGRLVLAGYRGTSPLIDFALVRYLSDGTLDKSFGVGGLATADAGGIDVANAVIQLPNGKLLAVGYFVPPGPFPNTDFLLARFLADGVLDTSFGAAGFLRTKISPQPDYCNTVVIAGPDLILTAGTTSQDIQDFALARYIASTPVELLHFEVE